MTDIIPNGVQIAKTCLEYISLNLCFLFSQNILTDLKGPKEKCKLHYGRCTGLLLHEIMKLKGIGEILLRL